MVVVAEEEAGDDRPASDEGIMLWGLRYVCWLMAGELSLSEEMMLCGLEGEGAVGTKSAMRL